jgi:hypothetical protein
MYHLRRTKARVASRTRDTRLFTAWACAVTLAVAARFYAPGRAASGGDWPAPLDDVFIHFAFARAWASGHPFEWIAGQGYSSGETAPAYAVLLAVGHAAGLRGAWLGVWAAVIACASLVFMMRALRRLARPGPSWLVLLAPPLLLACGTLDFAWFSGMEVAAFGAVAAALLVAVDRARRAGPATRARRQWCAGALGALLVLLRPEAAVVVAVAAFVVARRPGARSPWAAMARVALPGAAATVGLAVANLVFTGRAAAAGALLKLLSSNPFATDLDRARDYVINLASFAHTAARDLGDARGRFALALPVLALVSLASRRTRAPGVLCIGGAAAYALLVSWNGAARFQNFRDYAPPLALLLFAATLGVSALARRRRLRWVAVGLAVAGTGLGASHVGEAARFFARASRNIHEQQVEVGRRLARESPPGAIVLVGDAGAIPYFSGRHAVDALGLGGYHRVPFVRAAVHGEAATLELIERLPSADRPTVLALYPNWFPGITGSFGRETGRVSIADNVICGGATKVLYDADWGPMRAEADAAEPDEPFDGPVIDEIDLADIVSEEAHGYVSAAPHGGWTVFDIRTSGRGVRRFDAGRVVPEGHEESFAIAAALPAGATLWVRTDDSAFEATVHASTRRGGDAPVALARTSTTSKDRWSLARALLPVALQAGDRLRVVVSRGALRDFHAWVVGP